ncbi:MAG TPA: NAD(P)/FAD-dependent oxidoreductase [Candidatus Rubrimentiphilum sp.]|nr:NAD(P)/FAD-dependent oxidoreductase [Candidatus Rubrimentiphilum sp.]
MSAQFDVFVIGTGSAGSAAAFACADAGLSVAICDNLPFGGTCALRGCDPKKVLVAAEETVDLFHRMRRTGVVAGSCAIDWPGLMRFKRSFTDPVPAGRERSYAESKIATFHGTAAFMSRESLRIGEEGIEAEHFVVATGAKPAQLGFPGEEHLLDSTGFLELETLPSRIVFVGGGYISFEFAHICARAGAKATIIHRGKRPLEKFDAELVGKLVDATTALGVDVILDTAVSSIERSDNEFTVTANGQHFTADLVVHGAGRRPAITDLDIQRAGIAATQKGITVNSYLQSTTNSRVYAAGDSANSSGAPLTPVADYTGSVVAANIIHGNSKTISFDGIPSIVFTMPALGAVGLTQEYADAHRVKYRISKGDSSRWYSSRRVNEKTAAYRVLSDEASQRILGAHVVGPGTEELINLFAAAMQFNATAPQIENTILAYPTYGSDISHMVSDV